MQQTARTTKQNGNALDKPCSGLADDACGQPTPERPASRRTYFITKLYLQRTMSIATSQAWITVCSLACLPPGHCRTIQSSTDYVLRKPSESYKLRGVFMMLLGGSNKSAVVSRIGVTLP